METFELSEAQAKHLLDRGEGHFIDNKSTRISPTKLTRSLSAFANADGGELIVGIEEVTKGEFEWKGFAGIEDANGHIQHLEQTFPYSGDFIYEFLKCHGFPGFLLRIHIFKTRDIRSSSEGRVYVRRGAQNLPVSDDTRLNLLRRAKGLISHEDETLGADTTDITNSVAILNFVLEIVPEAEPEEWLRKQRMVVNDRPTVAGLVLFSDEPQTVLPKASVKIYRYKTADAEGTRDTLVFDPVTIEGCAFTSTVVATASAI